MAFSHRTIAFLFGLITLFAVAARAQSPAPEPLEVLEGRPDTPASAGSPLLGELFESRAGGIALRPPAGMDLTARGSTEQIARFDDERRSWRLMITRTSTREPLPLSAADARGGRRGLLEVAAQRLRDKNPTAQVLRESVAEVGDERGRIRAAVIVARLSLNGKPTLSQEALVQANDQLYYTVSLLTPGAPPEAPARDDGGHDAAPATQPAAAPTFDPIERSAAAAFGAMLDTIKLLDRSDIKREQNERLFRTRSLLVNLTPERVRQKLVPEMWLRVSKGGKDVGFSRIVELPARPQRSQSGADGSVPGVYVRIESLLRGDANESSLRSRAELFATEDRRDEDWSVETSTAAHGTDGEVTTSKVGVSDRQHRLATTGDAYRLEVKSLRRRPSGEWLPVGEPIKRELPPFYLSQAMGHLLPRLVAEYGERTYMFASYVAERREVMSRYIDVGREREVLLGGKRVRAIPITDRFGLEGPLTTHFVSPEGHGYLGSTSEGQGFEVLVTNEKDIRARFGDAVDAVISSEK